jgi:hypothetical protein
MIMDACLSLVEHSFRPVFWVMRREKYGKKKQGSGCSCAVEGREGNVL